MHNRLMPSRRALLAGGISALGAPACAAPTLNLGDHAAARGVQFGAAVEPQSLDGDADFAHLVQSQCRILTPENAMKWNQLRPTPDRFDFAAADRVAAIAAANQVPLHGHCLVWHEANPDWLGGMLNRRNAEALLREHIATVVRRYRGAVASWDVVNEAVERNDRRADGLRNSSWLRVLGPAYLDIAFEAAQAADPQARLVFADYGLEYDDEPWMVEKRGTMLNLLRDLLARGVPIGALGIQGHLRGERPPAFGQGLADFLAAVADLGLETYVTELDVDDQKMPGTSAQRDRAVANIYGRFLDVVLAEPAVKSVVTWGLSDRYSSKSWMTPRRDGDPVRPLPFDRDLRPKPAALAMARAFDLRR